MTGDVLPKLALTANLQDAFSGTFIPPLTYGSGTP